MEFSRNTHARAITVKSSVFFNTLNVCKSLYFQYGFSCCFTKHQNVRCLSTKVK